MIKLKTKKQSKKKRKKKAYACKPGGPPCLEQKKERKRDPNT